MKLCTNTVSKRDHSSKERVTYVDPDATCCHGLGRTLKAARTYAPRRRLTYFGKTLATSRPPARTFPGTLIDTCEMIKAHPRKNVAARARDPPLSWIAVKSSVKSHKATPPPYSKSILVNSISSDGQVDRGFLTFLCCSCNYYANDGNDGTAKIEGYRLRPGDMIDLLRKARVVVLVKDTCADRSDNSHYATAHGPAEF